LDRSCFFVPFVLYVPFVALDKRSHHGPGDEEAHEATRESKGAFCRLTIAAQQRAHDHHTTLPTVVLIEREDVAGCEEEIQPAEGRSISEETGNNIEDNSTEMDQELSAY